MDRETREHFIRGIDFALIWLRAFQGFLVGAIIANAIRVVASIVDALHRAHG